jgi:hypothetical protein
MTSVSAILPILNGETIFRDSQNGDG